jgi:hypothetical protein
MVAMGFFPSFLDGTNDIGGFVLVLGSAASRKRTLIDPSQFMLLRDRMNCAGPLPPNESCGGSREYLRREKILEFAAFNGFVFALFTFSMTL